MSSFPGRPVGAGRLLEEPVPPHLSSDMFVAKAEVTDSSSLP